MTKAQRQLMSARTPAQAARACNKIRMQSAAKVAMRGDPRNNVHQGSVQDTQCGCLYDKATRSYMAVCYRHSHLDR